jgi:LytS/YehU family sensor histidine kinase
MLPLDPHFIFNSLNHIQYFINNEEKAVALAYVSRFSKFMRQLIALSNTATSAIQDEVLLLGRYLELEKIRFEEKFDYSITILRHTGIETIKIPSLMLYHIASIMVYYRVLNSLNPVNIKINFEYSQQFISFTWEDNIILQESNNDTERQDKLTELLKDWNKTYIDRIVATQTMIQTDNVFCGSRLEIKFDTTGALIPIICNR